MGSSKFCAIHGGDGFAFVIQRAPNDEQLGYGGIRNSLAVEFEYSETKTLGRCPIPLIGPLLLNSVPTSAPTRPVLGVIQFLPYIETRYDEPINSRRAIASVFER